MQEEFTICESRKPVLTREYPRGGGPDKRNVWYARRDILGWFDVVVVPGGRLGETTEGISFLSLSLLRT